MHCSPVLVEYDTSIGRAFRRQTLRPETQGLTARDPIRGKTREAAIRPNKAALDSDCGKEVGPLCQI
jgi:hypothetical protein